LNNFENAFTFTIQNEGSTYTNKPTDKGGPTKFGITLSLLSVFLDRPATPEDVQILSEDTAKAIYQRCFWVPLRCDELPPEIATALFDTSVNRGQEKAVLYAQNCLVGIKADGIIGDKTIEAINHTEVDIFLYNFIGQLQEAYIKICVNFPDQLEYLDGWLKRSRRLFLLVGS
jgi:lysozyme family protein